MWARSYWICTKICFSYKEGVDKKLQEFEAEMEQKRQKVENLFLKHIWLVCRKEEEEVVLLTSLHVHVLIKNKERMMHKIISESAVWFSRFNSLS